MASCPPPSSVNPFRLRLVAGALAAALALVGCSGGDRGEASEDDPRQEPPIQSPALAEGDEPEGVGPSGGPPDEGGR